MAKITIEDLEERIEYLEEKLRLLAEYSGTRVDMDWIAKDIVKRERRE